MEDDSGKLTRISGAVSSTKTNPNSHNSTNNKEEGELSSSSEEHPHATSSHVDDRSLHQNVPIRSPLVKEILQQGKDAVTSVSNCDSARFVGLASRSCVTTSQHKKFEKNQVPFVISFSDDESGSDSEEHRQISACETKNNTIQMAGNRKSTVVSSSKMRSLPGNTRKGVMLPKKVSAHNFISSAVPNTRVSTMNDGHVKNFNPANRNKKEQESGYKQSVHLNSSKLQDLRQLIAIRENEIKLKAAKKRDSPSSSCKNDVTSLSIRGTKICQEAHDNLGQYELTQPEEPERKRLKFDKPDACLKHKDGRQGMPHAESTLVLGNSVLDNYVQQLIDSHIPNETVLAAGQLQKADASYIVKEGNASITNENQCKQIVQLAGRPTTTVYKPKDPLKKILHTAELGYPVGTNNQPPLSSVNNEIHESRPAEKAIEPVFKDKYEGFSANIPSRNLGAFDASRNNLNIWNSMGKVVSGTSNMDLQALMEIEDLHDKELEEAQEYRHKCELEERNALRSYRKAQRATVEANSKCAHLYRKREIFSAQLRSQMMDNPSMFWSSNLDDQLGEGFNSFDTPGIDLRVVSSDHQRESELYACDKGGNALIDRFANSTQQNISDPNEHIHSLAVDPRGETNNSMFSASSLHDHLGEGPSSFNDMPDVNMHDVPSGHQLGSVNSSQQKVCGQHEDVQDMVVDPSNKTNTVEPEDNSADGYQSSDSDMSAEEGDGIFLMDHETNVTNLDHQKKEEKNSEQRKHVYDESKVLDSSQDSLLLEASLRSQLFARLGVKKSLNKEELGQKLNAETESNTHDDNVDSGELNMGSLPLSNAKNDISSDLGGSERVERTLSVLPVEIKANCYIEKSSSNLGSNSTDIPLEDRFLNKPYQSLRSTSVLFPILKSAIVHMRAVNVVSLVPSHTECYSNGLHVNYKNSSNDIESVSSGSTPRDARDLNFNAIGSYSSNLNIDPLWPLCMYELRGKCNDDECEWQHVRDHSCRNVKIYNAADKVLAPSLGMMTSGATNFSKALDLLVFAPPSYLVCSDILKADLHAYKSILGHREACCWQKIFSVSLVLSSSLLTDLPSEPFLHGPGPRIESYGGWNRQSSYFHSRQSAMSQPNSQTGSDESLEKALLILSKEGNKQKGRIEALKVLARALEEDTLSAVLWIVYLHIYYCNQKSIGEDDMFSYAVENNRRSYDLWLMYINSREQLEDRLIAYNTSLSALCCDASPDSDATYASECILDIFLQMMNTLCISGNVCKAIKRLYELLPSRTTCKSHIFSDVLKCLTIWDKCIFWVCCVYLAMYKKLPDAVVSQFECQKELSALEWGTVQLTADEKQHASSLMEMAVDSLELDIDCESYQSATATNAAHLFAINHIRCLSVLEGLECGRNLLDKYIKIYPSCVELVLLAAREHELDSTNTSSAGFEKALNNWMEDIPGVQCIWNQYTEYALQSRKENYVKILMDRWFHSVWTVKWSELDVLDTPDAEKSPISQNYDAHICSSGDIDVSFGLLNLALYKLLQNDRTAAQSAIDKALESSVAENVKHCVREHAMFRLTEGSQSKDIPASEMLKILIGYVTISNAFPATELLSRKFIQTIKKSQVQQLVSNLLCPMSSDISLVNLVLQVCYGPSLIPQTYDKLADVVDLVESIMEILPGNYQLAMSVCKLLSRNSNSAVVASSVSFWASSVMVNALFKTVPVAPEYVWVEAASVLHDLTDIQSISLSFHKRALTVYPFSIKLWNSYLALCKIKGDGNAVKSEASKRGIELD